MASPWSGICCEACWMAKEKKCVCKCGGLYHGRGLQKEPTKEEYEEAGLTINPEYEALLPNLPFLEYEALKTSIQNEGLHFPIIVNFERVILDGHHRARACLELGIKPKIHVKTFSHKLFEKKFVIESNYLRRHLNKFQKAELAYALDPIYAELAKERQGTRTDLGSTFLPFGNEVPNNPYETTSTAITARTVGLTPRTYQRAKKILEDGSDRLKEKVRSGKTSIAYAYQSIMRAEKHENPPELPEGEFDVILADPPWNYSYMALDANPELHYNTMSLEDICGLDVPCADDAILYLWCTSPKIEEAFQVLNAWGFTYKTNMVWVKNGLGKGQGVGHYLKGDHELILIGKKGSIPVPVESNRPSSVLVASKLGHSKKPSEVYDLIERMYPNRHYLELFARESRQGWTSWGNQLEK